MTPSPIALTIAGSDPSGGAGIQADLKVFAAMGVYGSSVIATLTVQNSHGVQANYPVDASIVRAQLESLYEDFSMVAVKTGAFGNTENVIEVGRFFAKNPIPALVVDPVLYSSSGMPLLAGDAVSMLRQHLVPYAFLVTPNLFELRALTGSADDAFSIEEVTKQAKILLQQGAHAVLAKGGHRHGDPIDVLVTSEDVCIFSSARVQTTCTHGTGCTLSAAITGLLAKGYTLKDAIQSAKRYLTQAMQCAKPMGAGTGSLHHLFMLEPWV